MRVLVTGGTGYIGSHTCVELIQAGFHVTVLDNLSNSKRLVLDRIQEITGIRPDFIHLDLLDEAGMDRCFSENCFDAAIHFAGLKAVGESVKVPLRYYHNNITGTINLLQAMQKYGPKRLVFSSSATVYGMPDKMPITEDFPLGAINPYGRTKLMIEDILRDLYHSDHEWSIMLLRYFNPVGAHLSGRIGEDPSGIPNNLMPFISQTAIGRREKLMVYGSDYPTPDGTGIRDYIHVADLAGGHVNALEKAFGSTGIEAFNLGTGKGYSVLEIIHAFEKASGVAIPYTVVDRRPGDAAVCFSDPSRAQREHNWKAERGIDEMCSDSWRWQLNNPNGYIQD